MLWNDVPPIIRWHLAAAIVAVLVGLIQLWRTKGTVSHRWLGRTWLAAMYFVCASSLFIQALRPGHYSWIHLLSLWTLFTLSAGLWFIRRGDVRRHRNFMVGTFIGLLVAGGFAVFGEGRLIGRLLG